MSPIPINRDSSHITKILALGCDRGVKLWSLFIVLLLTTSCGQQATPTPPPPSLPTPTAASQPIASETAIATNTNDQLVVWLPAFSGVASESSAGAIFTNAFHQFEQRNPTINLDVQVKGDVGTTSLFNFLRSAQQVAPTILPDLVLINTQQLWQIVDLGMVIGLRDDELLDDAEFFPVGRAAALYRTQAVGIPYTIDLIHLAYDADEIATPPRTWTELLASDATFLYPAAEVGTANATLLQYIGAGGTLHEDGTISNPEALAQFFTFVAEARTANILPLTMLDLPGFNSVWRTFTEDRTTLAAIQVMQFYPNTTGIKPPSYTVVPTLNGEDVTVADVWAFAILTEDPQRRQLALTLIRDLLAPEVQGAWSQLVARLPSQPAALDSWAEGNGYRDFATELLGDAVAPPNGPAFADFARRLHSAQAGILRGELTVEDAVESMVALE